MSAPNTCRTLCHRAHLTYKKSNKNNILCFHQPGTEFVIIDPDTPVFGVYEVAMEYMKTYRPSKIQLLGFLLLLMTVVLSIVGCDPNSYSPSDAFKYGLQAPLLSNERVAILACKRSGISPINVDPRTQRVQSGNGSAPVVNPLTAGIANSEIASFHVLAINTTPAYSGVTPLAGQSPLGLKTAASIRFTSTQPVRAGEEPVDMVFAPNGRTMMASLKAANKVDFFHVGPNGSLKITKEIRRMKHPTYLAISKHGDYGFAVQEATNQLAVFDLTIQDPYYEGSSNPFVYGEAIDVVSPGMKNFAKLKRIVIVPSPKDGAIGGETLLAAASDVGVPSFASE
jgi:hypothetical protein